MNTIQRMWHIYKESQPFGNTTAMRIRRESFYAGATAMRDHMNTCERLGNELRWPNPNDCSSLEAEPRTGPALVCDNTLDMFNPKNPKYHKD